MCLSLLFCLSCSRDKEKKEEHWVKIVPKLENNAYFIEEPCYSENQSIRVKQDSLFFMWGQQPTMHKILKEQRVKEGFAYTLSSKSEELKNSIIIFKPMKKASNVIQVLWQKRNQEEIFKAFFTSKQNASKFELRKEQCQ